MALAVLFVIRPENGIYYEMLLDEIRQVCESLIGLGSILFIGKI